jgi:hypothetical protein
MLEAADRAVSLLSTNDVNEMKAMKVPHDLTSLTAKCVLTLFNMNNASDWATCQKFIGNMDFKKKLEKYDKDDIPVNTMNKVRQIL